MHATILEMCPTSRRGPGRPRQPIERSALIEIAARRFAEHGYATASLGDIAEAAGMRKASLYYHFPTKDELYAAVLDTAVVDLRQALAQALHAEGDFIERLDRLGTTVTTYFAEHPQVAKLLTREMIGDGEYARGQGRDAIVANLQATAVFLEAGMNAGVFRRQDPQQLALSIVGLHIFYFATALTTSAFLERDVFARGAVLDRKAAILEQVRALCLQRSPSRERRRTSDKRPRDQIAANTKQPPERRTPRVGRGGVTVGHAARRAR